MKTTLATIGLLALTACSPQKAPPPERLAAMRAIQAEVAKSGPPCNAGLDNDRGQAGCEILSGMWAKTRYLEIKKEILGYGTTKQKIKLAEIDRKWDTEIAKCPAPTYGWGQEPMFLVAENCRHRAIWSKMNDARGVMWSETPKDLRS